MGKLCLTAQSDPLFAGSSVNRILGLIASPKPSRSKLSLRQCPVLLTMP
jgi:hypothetical protein